MLPLQALVNPDSVTLGTIFTWDIRLIHFLSSSVNEIQSNAIEFLQDASGGYSIHLAPMSYPQELNGIDRQPRVWIKTKNKNKKQQKKQAKQRRGKKKICRCSRP